MRRCQRGWSGCPQYDRLFVLLQIKACILIPTSTAAASASASASSSDQQQQQRQQASSSSGSAKILGEFTVNPVFLFAFRPFVFGGPHGVGYRRTHTYSTSHARFNDHFLPRRPAGFEPSPCDRGTAACQAGVCGSGCEGRQAPEDSA